ncbi:MAG: peptidoglycan DD-metalloendopeptidase family protein [Clostridiales bacterium]|nr:peptidoglycan DD-metalloendopeptidase family protein [Clostridiales bacterium]
MLSLTSVAVMAQSSSKIRKDQRRNRQQVEKAQRDVKLNAQAVENKLHDLELLDGQVRDLNKDIRRLNNTSDSLLRIIRPLNDSISALNDQLAMMRSRYAAALRKSQSNASGMDDLTFVFSSSTFSQAWERYRSLKQFSRWRQRKAREILATRSDLEVRQQRLDSLKRSNTRVLKSVQAQRNEVERKRVDTDRLVKSLRTQNKQLQQILKRRQDEARRLEERLEKAIAEEIEAQRLKEEKELQERARQEEQRRRQLAQQKGKDESSNHSSSTNDKNPGNGKVKSEDSDNRASGSGSSTQASSGRGDLNSNTTSQATAASFETLSQINRKLTGSFESNKGRLPYPLAGKFTVVKKFGRQKHPRLPKVETDNPGIDIEATKNAPVHAVFDGEVSQIFKLAGYNNVVVLRHGDYVTVYANIETLNVKKGDKVKTGQQIGRLYMDKSDGGRSVLHFELRREKEKQNPELWLSR